MREAPAPAPLARRYAAWSLDAAAVAAAAVALTFAPLRAGLSGLDAALPPLLDAVLEAMLAALPALPAPQRLLADPAVAAAASAVADALCRALAPTLATFALLSGLYGAAFERIRGATPGKRVLGLRATDAAGGRLPAARCILRQAAGLLSWATLNLGHLLAAAPPRHQALHDRVAGARVIATASGRLPAWARAWLWLQAALACAALALLVHALQGAVDAALARATG